MKKITLLFILSFKCFSFAHPGWGIATDSQCNIYFTDIINKTIWKVSPNTKPAAFLTDVWSHSLYIKDDYLYFENEEYSIGNGWISLVKADTNGNRSYLIEPTRTGHGFYQNKFFVDDFENIYYENRDTLFMRNPAGRISPLITQGLKNVSAFSPQPNGQIFIADDEGIKEIFINGSVDIIATKLVTRNPADSPYPELNRPIFNRIYGISQDDSGNLFFAYHGNSRVYMINNFREVTEVYFAKGPWYPIGLIWHDGHLTILEEGHNEGQGPQALRLTQIDKYNNVKRIAQIGVLN